MCAFESANASATLTKTAQRGRYETKTCNYIRNIDRRIDGVLSFCVQR